MRRITSAVVLAITCIATQVSFADQALLRTHCAKCHGGMNPKGEFHLRSLGASPGSENVNLWVNALEYVKADEMPPAEQSKLTKTDRQKLVQFLRTQIRTFHEQPGSSKRTPPRRLNNRELANSISDVLLIEDVGTHRPRVICSATLSTKDLTPIAMRSG